MFNLLYQFAALTLISGLLLTLLPEGGLRRTATMVVGLLTLLLWADGLAGVFASLPDLPETYPATFVTTGYSLPNPTPIPSTSPQNSPRLPAPSQSPAGDSSP